MNDIKIISIKNEKLENCNAADIIIPCFMYRINISISKERSFNFIEQTIIKLIQEDDSLKDEKILSKKLGFYSQDKTKDKTELIKFILSKIKDYKIEHGNSECTKVYQFYQEAYTMRLLPVITKNFNSYTYIEKSYIDKFCKTDGINLKNIEFNDGNKNIKAFLIDNYKKTHNVPSKREFIQTIYKHNRANIKSDNTEYVDHKSFNISSLAPELVFLHVKIIELRSTDIAFTNGWTNDFSLDLMEIMNENFQKELHYIKKEKFQIDNNIKDIDDKKLPFHDHIQKYQKITRDIKYIEKNSKILAQKNISSVEKNKGDRTLEILYDLIENTLYETVKHDNTNTTSIFNIKLIEELAEKIGFYLEKQKKYMVFRSSKRDNLQKYLCKAIFFQKESLKFLANKSPDFINTLELLLSCRGNFKHAGVENKNIYSIDEILSIKEKIYLAVSILLKIKQNKTETTKDEISNVYFMNSRLIAEEKISPDIFSKMSQDLQDELIYLFDTLDNDWEKWKSNIIKSAINSVYRCLEIVLIGLLDLYMSHMQSENKTMDMIKEEVSNKYIISPKLSSVTITARETFNKRGTLGAYVLVFLYCDDNVAIKDIRFLEKIIDLRGHGNEDLNKFSNMKKDELAQIINEATELIKKLVVKQI